MVTRARKRREQQQGGGKGGVSSRARGKEWVLVMAAKVGRAVVVARKTTINSLIKKVIFKKIAFSDAWATMGTSLKGQS